MKTAGPEEEGVNGQRVSQDMEIMFGTLRWVCGAAVDRPTC